MIMPLIEVDEAEVQQSRKLKELVETMAKDPRTRREFTKLVKTVNPESKLPDPPAEPWEDKVTALEKQLADERKAREDAEAKRAQDERLGTIKQRQDREFGELRQAKWTDDGLKKVQELMDQEGILSPLIAASHIERLHPPQAPVTPSGSGSWNFAELSDDGDADLKKLIDTKGESMPLTDKMVRDALADHRGHR